jgi:hypothetical protein
MKRLALFLIASSVALAQDPAPVPVLVSRESVTLAPVSVEELLRVVMSVIDNPVLLRATLAQMTAPQLAGVINVLRASGNFAAVKIVLASISIDRFATLDIPPAADLPRWLAVLQWLGNAEKTKSHNWIDSAKLRIAQALQKPEGFTPALLTEAEAVIAKSKK